ncbi:MAG: hypothetical protein ACF8MJ_00545 [Phycisphaerales bacterium JB050]
MTQANTSFRSFPSTQPPPEIVPKVVEVFERHHEVIAPAAAGNRFGSDNVLSVLRDDLVTIGFDVELSKKHADKLQRPVFFGEGGEPSLHYEVDAYHPESRCGLEVEAGRGLAGGNAFYRDIVQAMVMIDVDHLIICLLHRYSGGSGRGSSDYAKAVSIAESIYAHDRVTLPFGLTVIGYGPR